MLNDAITQPRNHKKIILHQSRQRKQRMEMKLNLNAKVLKVKCTIMFMRCHKTLHKCKKIKYIYFNLNNSFIFLAWQWSDNIPLLIIRRITIGYKGVISIPDIKTAIIEPVPDDVTLLTPLLPHRPEAGVDLYLVTIVTVHVKTHSWFVNRT